jgi:hypothetical protein
MANSNPDINAARQIYAAALRAADSAAQWCAKQGAQVEDEYQSAIQLAESTQQTTQERAQQSRDKGTEQAARMLADVNKAVAEGDRLFAKVNLGKGVGAYLAPSPAQRGGLSAQQMLIQAQRDSADALRNLRNAISELHRLRNANKEQLKWIVISTVIGISILLFVVLILVSHH